MKVIIIGDSHRIVSFIIIPPKGFLLTGKNYRMPIFYFLLLPPSSFSGLEERLHSFVTGIHLGWEAGQRGGGRVAGLHRPLEVLLVLQAKPPPNVDHSGPQKKKSSERSVEPNPYLDFTPIMYITSFPGGNWVGRRNKKRLLTGNTQCEDARQCQPWWGAAGVLGEKKTVPNHLAAIRLPRNLTSVLDKFRNSWLLPCCFNSLSHLFPLPL